MQALPAYLSPVRAVLAFLVVIFAVLMILGVVPSDAQARLVLAPTESSSAR